MEKDAKENGGKPPDEKKPSNTPVKNGSQGTGQDDTSSSTTGETLSSRQHADNGSSGDGIVPPNRPRCQQQPSGPRPPIMFARIIVSTGIPPRRNEPGWEEWNQRARLNYAKKQQKKRCAVAKRLRDRWIAYLNLSRRLIGTGRMRAKQLLERSRAAVNRKGKNDHPKTPDQIKREKEGNRNIPRFTLVVVTQPQRRPFVNSDGKRLIVALPRYPTAEYREELARRLRIRWRHHEHVRWEVLTINLPQVHPITRELYMPSGRNSGNDNENRCPDCGNRVGKGSRCSCKLSKKK